MQIITENGYNSGTNLTYYEDVPIIMINKFYTASECEIFICISIPNINKFTGNVYAQIFSSYTYKLKYSWGRYTHAVYTPICVEIPNPA